MADTKTHTYEEIRDAVFYSQQKPEVLADLLAEALGVTVPDRPANLVLGAKPTEAPLETPPKTPPDQGQPT